jgi:hypothetical protein
VTTIRINAENYPMRCVACQSDRIAFVYYLPVFDLRLPRELFDLRSSEHFARAMGWKLMTQRGGVRS